MKKIIILGAGIGGLSVASLLDEKEYDITIYEKKSNIEELGYSWKDDVNLNKLRSIGFNFDVKSDDEIWNIFSCAGDKVSFLSNKDEIAPIDRKYLASELYKRASKKAKIYFNTEVIAKDNNYIVVNDKIIDDFDLLIDARGCLNTEKKQTFYTKRIILDQINKKECRNVFLKPGKINGVAWCNYSNDETDILIGQLGKLDKLTIKNTLNFIEDKTGVTCKYEDIDPKIYEIPVRYPSTLFFYNKYVILGDLANMTVPLIGSGIVNTMEASYILADILNNINLSNNLDERNNQLWQYQYNYYKKCAISSTQIDIFKNWLLTTNEDNIDYLFQNGIISSKDLGKVMIGDFIDYDLVSLIDKASKIYSNPLLTLDLSSTLYKAIRAKQLIKNMPENYDEKNIRKWRGTFIKNLKR